MSTEPAFCPPRETLKARVQGQLDPVTAETIDRHLASCVECRTVVAEVSAGQAAGTFSTIAGEVSDPFRTVPFVTPPGAAANSGNLNEHPDFELLKELGRGGMGVVYLVRNRWMDRLEVLKVVNSAVLGSADGLERFQREIRAAARLNHPNIVAAHSVLRQGELLIFAMEYVAGQDLAQVVKRHGPLPVANATFYAQQAALGLQHAHEKGMVHRDIKPNNLMLAIEGKKHVVKILDFGLAKASSEKPVDGGLTQIGQMLGTPQFIAPEQTLDAHQADIRADIYSLGCTLYFLLSGRPPFEGTSLYEIVQAHHTSDAVRLNQVRPDVPAELAAIVAKMMSKEPADRYSTPAEVARALGPFYKSGAKVDVLLPTPIPSPDAQQPVLSPFLSLDRFLQTTAKPRPVRANARPAAAAIAAAAFVIFSAVGLYFWNSSSEQAAPTSSASLATSTPARSMSRDAVTAPEAKPAPVAAARQESAGPGTDNPKPAAIAAGSVVVQSPIVPEPPKPRPAAMETADSRSTDEPDAKQRVDVDAKADRPTRVDPPRTSEASDTAPLAAWLDGGAIGRQISAWIVLPVLPGTASLSRKTEIARWHKESVPPAVLVLHSDRPGVIGKQEATERHGLVVLAADPARQIAEFWSTPQGIRFAWTGFVAADTSPLAGAILEVQNSSASRFLALDPQIRLPSLQVVQAAADFPDTADARRATAALDKFEFRVGHGILFMPSLGKEYEFGDDVAPKLNSKRSGLPVTLVPRKSSAMPQGLSELATLLNVKEVRVELKKGPPWRWHIRVTRFTDVGAKDERVAERLASVHLITTERSKLKSKFGTKEGHDSLEKLAREVGEKPPPPPPEFFDPQQRARHDREMGFWAQAVNAAADRHLRELMNEVLKLKKAAQTEYDAGVTKGLAGIEYLSATLYREIDGIRCDDIVILDP